MTITLPDNLSESAKSEIRLINVLGQIVKTFTSYMENNIRLSLTEVGQGSYYLQIRKGKEIYSVQKLIIIK